MLLEKEYVNSRKKRSSQLLSSFILITPTRRDLCSGQGICLKGKFINSYESRKEKGCVKAYYPLLKPFLRILAQQL